MASTKETYSSEKTLTPTAHKWGRHDVVTLINEKTREVLPILSDSLPSDGHACEFLRCHFTGEEAFVDQRLVEVAVRAARSFGKKRVEVISGYRAPKYNRLLRKKGREVARSSRHMLGQALDFRIPGVPVERLRNYVARLGSFGIGTYEGSNFVHVDTGPSRRWKGR